MWRAPVADIELRRDSAGLAGDVDLVLAVGESQTRLSGDFLFPRGSERISARGQFVGLQSEALIPLLPRLGPLAGLTMTFDGTLRAVLRADGRVASVDFEVAGVNGRLDAPDTFSEPLDLRRIALRGQAIGAEHQIDIETLSVQWGTAERPGPEILASVSLAATGPGFGGDLSVGAEAVLTGLEVSELGRYWPVSLKPGRKWVVRNIVRGHLDELRVQTALHLRGRRMDQIELRRLDGAMSYRDLAVHYWRPMPPATGITGTAVFDHKALTFTSQGARLQELQVESAVVKIVGLDSGKETVQVDLDFGGPLRNALALLDHDRLRLIRKLDIDPGGASGRFTGNLKLQIPIYVRTTLDNMEVWATAQLEQATIRRILLGQDATEGQLALVVDKTAMEVRGPLRFGDVPIEIVWNENFAEDAAIRSQLEARISRNRRCRPQGPRTRLFALLGGPGRRRHIVFERSRQERPPERQHGSPGRRALAATTLLVQGRRPGRQRRTDPGLVRPENCDDRELRGQGRHPARKRQRALRRPAAKRSLRSLSTISPSTAPNSRT